MKTYEMPISDLYLFAIVIVAIIATAFVSKMLENRGTE